MFKFAIIGFGGLGKVHFNAYLAITKENLADMKLVALCDVTEEAFTSVKATNITDGTTDSYDFSEYRIYKDYKELLSKEDLDFVITALPTYLHSKIAVDALNAGLHVFSEKPMALTVEQGSAMLEAAHNNNKKLMIGQCCRYETPYVVLKNICDSGELGKVLRAEFNRYSLIPTWSWQNWMLDEELSGGAALDMHVHDVDMINYIFGMPEKVSATATHHKTGFDSIVATYYYDDCVVTSIGDWSMQGSYPFTEYYLVRFENGVLEFIRDTVTKYTSEGTVKINLKNKNEYIEEILDFVSCIQDNKESSINPPESSLDSIKIAIAEKDSAKSNKIIVFK